MTAQPLPLPPAQKSRSESCSSSRNPYRCSCGASWGGLKTCHCPACHETFTGPTAFDKHRAGSHIDATRRCTDPKTVGLVDAGREYRCWALPGEWRP